jgi:hypothetical protein
MLEIKPYSLQHSIKSQRTTITEVTDRALLPVIEILEKVTYCLLQQYVHQISGIDTI